MPTPSNIPRMSGEDEALMWDILDLSSSSSSTGTTQLGNLVPSQEEEEETETGSPHLPEQLPTPTTTQEVGPGDHEKGSTDQEPQDISLLYGRISESIAVDQISMSEWPFLNRNGADGLPAAIPDIPDWMMLDEYMTEHL